MRLKLLCVAGFLPVFALAQSVDINDVSSQGSDSTTIEISKGKPDSRDWETVDGAVPITGEPAPSNRAARRNWQRACDEWKKEFREDNKESRVISTSCGSPECSGPAGQKSCASTARFQIKTRITAD